jgi:Ca2+-binding EF-hand superfamily protein
MGTSSLFSGVTSGLTNTYSILSTASSGSVTATNIASAMSNSTYASSLSSGFASYILSNFATLDKNSDGTLSASELSTLTNSINATGLTATQLTQLGSASGLSNETLEQVLEHFTDIDANGDGKVTSAEISSYKIKSAMDKKKAEFSNKAAADQSIFYGDSDSSSKTDSSSMLSFKYWNDGSSSDSSSSS